MSIALPRFAHVAQMPFINYIDSLAEKFVNPKSKIFIVSRGGCIVVVNDCYNCVKNSKQIVGGLYAHVGANENYRDEL